MRCWDLPRGSDGKQSACSAEDPGLIPGSGLLKNVSDSGNDPLSVEFALGGEETTA